MSLDENILKLFVNILTSGFARDLDTTGKGVDSPLITNFNFLNSCADIHILPVFLHTR